MQIRPRPSLLQAIAKASEPKPVPFAQRLADLAAVGPAAAPAAKPQPDHSARASAASPQAGGAPGSGAVIKPRGSVINLVV